MEINDKENGLIKRLTNKTFKFDKRFMDGYYSANYFIKTRKIVLEHLQGHIAKMQFFQRSDPPTVQHNVFEQNILNLPIFIITFY